MRTFSLTTRLAAPAERVWERAVTLAGVNAVLRPILRMTAPPGLRDATIADLRPGEPAGRSWLLLGGLAERTVEPLTAGTLSLPDALGFELRSPLRHVPGSAAPATRVVALLFPPPPSSPRGAARGGIGGVGSSDGRRNT